MGRNLIAPMTRAKMDAALNNTEGLYPKRWGSDFYHRYKEDIALYVFPYVNCLVTYFFKW